MSCPDNSASLLFAIFLTPAVYKQPDSEQPFEVLEYMKTNDLLSKIPVSIISGDSTKETIDKAFTYQIVDMLEKPFTENDIKRIVEKTIQYKNFN